MRSLLLVLICMTVAGLCKRRHRGRGGYALGTYNAKTTVASSTTTGARGDALSLMWGNGSTKGNLQSALTVLAPENLPKAAHALRTNPITPKYSYDVKESAVLDSDETGQSKNHSKDGDDVVLEVINIGSYPVSRNRFNIRFIAVTSLYVLSGVCSLIVTYCLAKAVLSRRKRQHQYTLLTKSDMDYHRGGGGI